MILTNYAIKFRVAVFTLSTVLVVIGIYTYLTMPREGAPDIIIPYVFVTANYEGVAPAEIEKLITIPLEKQFKDLDNVKEITSSSAEGLSFIEIEFLPKEDINNALQRVKDKIDLARPDLPQNLDEPVVNVVNFSTDWPIMMLALSGKTNLYRLNNIGEKLQDKIEFIPGVKEAQILGMPEREIRVEINPSRLSEYRVPISAVANAIAQENANTSAGNLETAGNKFQVRIPGEFSFANEIKDIVVCLKDGKPIYLTDIANISDTNKDISTMSRINGEPCISLVIKKRSGVNTLDVIKSVKKAIQEFNLPEGIKLTTILDQSSEIDDQIHELENSMFSGFILVVLIIIVFMGWRNSLFIGLSIPLSLLLAFPIFHLMDVTLNMVVLFGLVMTTGMVVDDAIVMCENIYRHRCLGESKEIASISAASEVAWPIITSTLTNVIAFWSLFYWPSIIGQFMRYLPITLVVTLLCSLFVGIIVNPAYASVFSSAGKKQKFDQFGEIIHQHWFLDYYEKILRGALNHRIIIMVIAFAFLILSVLLYKHFGLGIELFPDTDPRNAFIKVRYPQGTDIGKTDSTIKKIEQLIGLHKDVQFYLSNVGFISSRGEQQVGTHLGSITIKYLDFNKRHSNTSKLTDEIRETIGDAPGAEIVVEKEEIGPPTESPISIEVSGDDIVILSKLADEIIRIAKTLPGLVDLKKDIEDALPEIQLKIDRKRASMLGLNSLQVGDFLRTFIYGSESSKFRAGKDEYDITVRLPLDYRNSANMLKQVFIPTELGRNIPVSSLGKLVYTGGQGEITRKNQKRVITITGNLQERSIDAVLLDVNNALNNLQLPLGYNIKYTGQNEDIAEASTFLMKAFLIAIALIAVILVIQFNSIINTLIIMSTVVLSIIGIIWGLLICQMRFSIIMTGIGVISLAGVVVKNAIVLIDCINQQRSGGKPIIEAIITASRYRLRPVLLTAITSVLGLIPMAIGWSLEFHSWPWSFVHNAESGQWWAPMAVAIIFGLALSTILTLVLVPIMYSITSSVTNKLKLLMQEKT